MNPGPKFIAEGAGEVSVPNGRPKSKTWAIKKLARYFIKPFFKNATTDEDRTKGDQRLRLFCTNRNTGAVIGVVEVVGKPDALPKAAVIGACQRIGVKVTFDSNGGALFEVASETPP